VLKLVTVPLCELRHAAYCRKGYDNFYVSVVSALPVSAVDSFSGGSKIYCGGGSNRIHGDRTIDGVGGLLARESEAAPLVPSANSVTH
jgi:hypothetical protein